jgi:hypothetical protein
MDEPERELDKEKAEHQLDESKARIEMIEARARKSDAAGAMAEASGLRAAHQRITGQFRAWKDADVASAVELRDAFKRGIDALSRDTDAAGQRLDRLDDATDRWLDAETDQVGASVDAFDAWLGDEWVEDKREAVETRADLQAGWQDVKKKRVAMKVASEDKKDEARRSLEESLGRMKAQLKTLGDKMRPRREEQPHG